MTQTQRRLIIAGALVGVGLLYWLQWPTREASPPLRIDPPEAEMVYRWVYRNNTQIRAYLDTTMADSVAIVTPKGIVLWAGPKQSLLEMIDHPQRGTPPK